MWVIPAVDIREGQCVRLLQGRPECETVYAKDPVRVAQRWEAEGARRLHVADLDGVLTGTLQNGPIIRQLLDVVKIPVQVGGGIRDLETIRQLFDWGAATVIVGTLAVEHPELVRQVVAEYGDRVMVSIDVVSNPGMGGGLEVVTSGWTRRSAKSGEALAEAMRTLGVKGLVVTDTERDGTLMGLNIDKLQRFVHAVTLPVIVAGGVARLDDLKRLVALESNGIVGVIIGKALYEGTLSLEDALRVAV